MLPLAAVVKDAAVTSPAVFRVRFASQLSSGFYGLATNDLPSTLIAWSSVILEPSRTVPGPVACFNICVELILSNFDLVHLISSGIMNSSKFIIASVRIKERSSVSTALSKLLLRERFEAGIRSDECWEDFIEVAELGVSCCLAFFWAGAAVSVAWRESVSRANWGKVLSG